VVWQETANLTLALNADLGEIAHEQLKGLL